MTIQRMDHVGVVVDGPGGMSRTRSRLRPRSEHGHNGPYA
jgi:hypothetical protein